MSNKVDRALVFGLIYYEPKIRIGLKARARDGHSLSYGIMYYEPEFMPGP